MTLEALEGIAFADRPYRLCAEKVREFTESTGDDPSRWQKAAPPGFAASLLFVVAPELLSNPVVDGPVIHGDQSFSWHRPLTVERELTVTGRVERVRSRGDVAFLNFSFDAGDADGPLVEGKSTFLVGGRPNETTEQVPPAVLERAETASPGTDLPSPRSASRHDLVRYAAATRDWNPIHWDHAAAVAAGLGGVVVHGLLQSAWLTQVAAAFGLGDCPVRTARFRYTAPLRPAEAAEIRGQAKGEDLDLSLNVGDRVTVSGRFKVIS
jgi:acyl dehydratase